MKLRNKILAIAVVAVAGVNVYLANDVNARNNALSMLNLENIADANEPDPGDAGNGGGRVQAEAWAWFPIGSHTTYYWDGRCVKEIYYDCRKHTMCETECQPGQTKTETRGC